MKPAQVKPPISPDLLNQIDVRVGTILSVLDVPNSEKLLALEISFGDHKRTVLAGMKRERARGFASEKTHGKTSRFGGMLVRDYLYPAAEQAGIIFRQQDGSYLDSTGRKVTRFGFHNLRKAVSDYLNEGKKADVRTIQDTLRHENPEMTLARYTESSLESRLAAQDVMASAVLGESTRVQ